MTDTADRHDTLWVRTGSPPQPKRYIRFRQRGSDRWRARVHIAEGNRTLCGSKIGLAAEEVGQPTDPEARCRRCFSES
jgi:hypothetical protein